MASASSVTEIDVLDGHLLSEAASQNDYEDHDVVLIRASFDEMEEKFVKYQTALWILTSVALILACGIGLIMLLYLPLRRWIVRRDFRSRKLYVTPNAIVYKVTKPVFLPFFGVLKKEKHILLPAVADVIVEQGYLQSLFGIYSIRIENLGVRRPASDDVQIQGIIHAKAFRKAILMLLSSIRNESFTRQPSVSDDAPNNRLAFLRSPQTPLQRTKFNPRPDSPSQFLHEPLQSIGEQLLHKLEEVGSSVKKVQSLMEGQV